MQWDNNQTELNDCFSISWIDLPDNQGISFSKKRNSTARAKIIGCYVFAVGKNEDYIIAKQHPSNDRFCKNPDLKVTNYFIIENVSLNNEENYTIYGPMDTNKFEIMRKELDIEDLEFSIQFPENPNEYGIMRDYL
jgi:hypothetical protein